MSEADLLASWQDFIPPDWKGTCIVCGGELTAADWAKEDVVAATVPGGLVCSHASHLEDRYDETVQKMAQAVVEMTR